MTDTTEDAQADGYYDEADTGANDEIDLSFLDEDEEKSEPDKKNL